MKKGLIILGTFVLLAFVSCKKDTNMTPTPSLVGTWNLLGLNGNSQTSIESSSGGVVTKVVTNTAYASFNNSGNMVFSDTVVNGIGLSYSVDTMSKSYTYINGVLKDSSEVPVSFSSASTNTTAGYKLSGSDSITITSGSLLGSGGGTVVPSFSTGGRFVLNGNSLTLNSSIYKDTIQVIGTVTQRVISSTTSSIVLQRQ